MKFDNDLDDLKLIQIGERLQILTQVISSKKESLQSLRLEISSLEAQRTALRDAREKKQTEKGLSPKSAKAQPDQPFAS